MQLTRAHGRGAGRGTASPATRSRPDSSRRRSPRPCSPTRARAAGDAAQTTIGRNGELDDLHGAAVFLASRRLRLRHRPDDLSSTAASPPASADSEHDHEGAGLHRPNADAPAATSPSRRWRAGRSCCAIDAVGICGSDMHAYHGHDPRRVPPLILGHELAGTIVAGPGPGTARDRQPAHHLRRCDYCAQGRNNLCANRTMVGMTRPGAFAERMSIPAAASSTFPQDMDARVRPRSPSRRPRRCTRSTSSIARARPSAARVRGAGARRRRDRLLVGAAARAYGVARRSSLAETNPLRRASRRAHVGCRTFDPREGAGPREDSDRLRDRRRRREGHARRRRSPP